MLQSLKRFIRPGNPRWRFFRDLPPSARVLDLGCGRGDNGVYLRELHGEMEIHGVDILAQDQVPRFIVYQVCDLDASTLPYPDAFFDAVVFTHVIEHLRRPLDLGREIGRVMRPGATVYIETPNWTTMFVPSFGLRRDDAFPFNFFDDHTHVKPWTKQGLFNFLTQACGLEVMRVGTVRNWLRLPFDLPAMAAGYVMRRRPIVVAAFWNLYGWCIYGTAVKRER